MLQTPPPLPMWGYRRPRKAWPWGRLAVAGWGRWQWWAGRREKVRPARPLQRPTREKVRPARQKTPILGHYEHAGRTFSRSHPPPDPAGRTFSRTGRTEVVTVKPTTPLQPLIQASVKPPSPMQAKNAPKTPNFHPQRRCQFQLRLGLCPQRRWRFQTTTPPGLLGLTGVPTGSVGSDRHTFACNSFANASCFEVQSLKFRAFHSETERRREGIACDIECLSIGAHYVVEMGGIEPLSLCGAEHHKCSSCGGCRRDRKARLRRPWAMAGPGWAIHSDPFPLVWRAPEGPEGTGEPQNAGPGRGAGGRWQGQGGPRDRPLRAAGSRVAISRAGRRPPAHTAAGPSGARNTSGATSINTQREAARPHRVQAAHASGDSCQKPRIS